MKPAVTDPADQPARPAEDEPASLFKPVRSFAKALASTARLMVGVPDYEAYVRHRQDMHPGEPVMSYAEFFKERQNSRYATAGGKISRCC